jgi:phenylpropionate dioxygenase-like ring-hydroxylating dioxygenase large terminal subunit
MAEGWKIAALEKLHRLVAAGGQDMADEASTVAVDTYTSTVRANEEKQHVFDGWPLVVGFSCQVRNPGDYLTHDFAGVPLLVTRDREGVLRAFLNVCRHRGAKVVLERYGNKKAFSCGYHGWTYEGTGALKGIRLPQGFPDVKCADRGLVALPVEEIAGLIFVRTTPGPELRMRDALGPLAEQLESFGLASRAPFKESAQEVRCNWKLVVESSLESYHIATLHKDTGGTYLESSLIYDGFGPHGRVLLPYKEAMRAMTCHLPIDPILQEAAVAFLLFPNTIILLLAGCAHVLSTFPLGASRCVMHGTTLVASTPRNESAPDLARVNYDGYWATIREDIAIVESIQCGLDAGANTEFLVGRHEFPVARFHSAIAGSIAKGLRETQ